MTRFNLQLLADGDNNDLAVRSYQKDFKELLQAVFASEAHFDDFFAGGLEALDGVQNNEDAFYVKTSDIPVVIGEGYNTNADVAFGSGTGNSNRFGERTEIIYSDTPVKYTWGWNYHEGIDRYTVNNDFDAAVADRLEAQARAKTAQFDSHHAAFISENASQSFTLASADEEGVIALFDALSAYFNNIRAIGTKIAKVNSTIYNVLADAKLTNTSKNSTANIDTNTIELFKGFQITEVPDDLFGEGECVYAYIANVGKAFTGINTARTIEAQDFDGVALQGAGKAGEYILPDNKKAVVKGLGE